MKLLKVTQLATEVVYEAAALNKLSPPTLTRDKIAEKLVLLDAYLGEMDEQLRRISASIGR